MKRNENNEAKTGKEWYRKKIVEMVEHIESEITLKKIYTFTRTLKDILSEKEGG